MDNLQHICTDIIKTKQLGFSSSDISNKTNFKIKQFLDKLVYDELKNEYENKCCNEGLVLPNSIEILERSNAFFPLESTKLYYNIKCKFKMTVCCPHTDSLIECEVISKNKIGLLCKLKSSFSPLIILVPNDLVDDESEIEKIDKTNISESIFVKVIGKKFENYDKKITVLAKIV